jgi:RNA polymerase sigma-70 factor (ECF subfamily)
MEETHYIHPNADWVKGCRKNDRKAQLMLYQSYSKTMYNTAYRIVRNTQEAEDIMQESFIHAFQKINQLHEDEGFGAWLRRIVINRSLDAVKKNKTWILQREKMKEEVNGYDEQTEEDLDYRMSEIQQAMENIPDQYRAILCLHFFEGMDYEEMMLILNLKYNNVKTRIARARTRLLEEIVQMRKHNKEQEVYHEGH